MKTFIKVCILGMSALICGSGNGIPKRADGLNPSNIILEEVIKEGDYKQGKCEWKIIFITLIPLILRDRLTFRLRVP